MPGIRVAALWVYPVKACRAVSMDRARVGRRGLDDDRRFMVIDPDGTFLSQRTEPRLATVTTIVDDGVLRLSADGHASVAVPCAPTSRERRPVRVHSSYASSAWSMGTEAARFLSEVLGRAAELVKMPDDEERRVAAKHAPEGALVSFADAFPLLLTSSTSLDDLSERAGTPIPMARFRPNVVVSGAAPYDEDRWSRLRIGDVFFRAPKLCDRCVVTTTDQLSGARGPEPLRTLATYRAWDGAVWFGTNLVPESEGDVAVGDHVEVVDRR
ncbi:MAG: MOSC domain-containing protein [Deltaproteobacteria bacterium]|nr:MOSC domain-containing protein [Deltaproteobacteria bacterium]